MDKIRQLIAKLPQDKRVAYIDALKTLIIEKKVPEVLGNLNDKQTQVIIEEVKNNKYEDKELKLLLSELEDKVSKKIDLLDATISSIEIPDTVVVQNFPKSTFVDNMPESIDIDNIEKQEWVTQRLESISSEINSLKQTLKDEIVKVKVMNPSKTTVTGGGGGGVIPFTTSGNNTQKALVDNDGTLISRVTIGDGANLDAFQRLRTSDPLTIFDSKQIYSTSRTTSEENYPLFFDNAETVGVSTWTTYSVNQASTTLGVINGASASRVRQTKRRFNYQPGKSQLIFLTFNMRGFDSNIVKREGYFDSNNGIFLEMSSNTAYLCIRSNATGAPVDTRVAQSNWNIDKLNGQGKTGYNLDLTKTQILVIDMEWLGVGRVRTGFVIDGKICYAHEFNHANSLEEVYMSTPNLPLRSEINNVGSGVSSCMDQICSTVISEGGIDVNGSIRTIGTGVSSVTLATSSQQYPFISFRLKDGYISETVNMEAINLFNTSAGNYQWKLILNPTLTGASFVWTGVTDSGIEYHISLGDGVISGGYDIYSGYGTGRISEVLQLTNAIRLGSKIDGTKDIITLAITPLGTNQTLYGTIQLRELL